MGWDRLNMGRRRDSLETPKAASHEPRALKRSPGSPSTMQLGHTCHVQVSKQVLKPSASPT